MAKEPELKPLTPPYVAFSTFKSMIAGFKEHVLPSRVDRSVLGNFSGIVGGQLITTLRFLGLIDPENKPTPALKALVETVNTNEWPQELTATLKRAYAPIFQLNLQSASPSQFGEHFASNYPGEGSTQRKSMTFLLTAIQEAKIPISPYILKNKKPRSAPTKKRAARQNGQGQRVDPGSGRIDPPPVVERKLSEQVLAILDKKDLKPEVEQAVYVVLKHLREEGR
jgi:Family of unknown function (DUF5343)